MIISFSRSKRVNGKSICLCTRSEENLFSWSSTATVMLLHEEEDEESVKILFTNLVIFSSNLLLAVTFLHILHLDVLRGQIEIEIESKN